ncbi:GNAT family N-acetyltransferase [soil metagenome]
MVPHPDSNLTIRRATPDDADVIASFNVRLAEETEQVRLDGTRLRHGVNAILGDPAKGLYFLAEVDGHPVGQLSVTYEWSDWRNGRFLWLQSVYVDASHRGKGTFNRLFNHLRTIAEEDASVCGFRLYVDKSNTAAHSIYRELGFEAARYDLMELAFPPR